MRRLWRRLPINRLQRKVMLVVAVLIVVPMVLTGAFTAAWVTKRVDASIENWLRESTRLNLSWLDGLHHNGRLFADVLADLYPTRLESETGGALIPVRLQPLARELGISFVQRYGLDGRLLQSSVPLRTAWKPEAGQDEAVIRVERGSQRLLAAVTVVDVPAADRPDYRLVIGTLFDKELLQRLGITSGLKTRLYYPSGSDFAKAFADDKSAPLRLRLPPEAFDQLQKHQEYFSPEAEGGEYWGLYTPVLDSAGNMEAVLFSGLAHHKGDQLLADRNALTWAIALLGTLFGGGLGLLLSRLVIRPVEELRDGVVKVAAQDFKAQIPVHGHDELADLARAFNTMAESLRHARDEQQRGFQRDKLTALGELSLAMAHEIRNPIGVINTATQLFEKAKGDPERQADLTRMMREESARLNTLLRDFQQLARHRKPEFEAMPPQKPLEAALRYRLAGRPDVVVKQEYGHGEARIEADAELLQQAWTTLINNALEAIGERPAQLTLRSWLEGATVCQALDDNGPGVPIERVPRLFEPFYTSKEHGSGLGLTICNTLVEANGGRLEYAPARGGGASFVMRFAKAAGEG
jgi:signal transduction histidine kinase